MADSVVVIMNSVLGQDQDNSTEITWPKLYDIILYCK